MNQKDFNILINEISNKLNPLNQLLYESLILIVFYYMFDVIKNIKTHKSFILLITIICIILDLCIWQNYSQSLLFIAILIIYNTYNINKLSIIDMFINTMNNSNNINNNNIIKKWKIEEDNIKNQNEINKITFIPKNIDTTADTNPEPYDKLQQDINEVHLVYKSSVPNVHITDTQYAKIMLNELYDTPQYKNIKKNKIDISLDNDINTINISNQATVGKVSSFTLIMVADGTARVVNWPSSFMWPNSTAPTITFTNGKQDVFTFFTKDGGTTYYAFISGQNL